MGANPLRVLDGLITDSLTQSRPEGHHPDQQHRLAHDVDQTTVTPKTNDGGATYVVKLDDTVDENGAVELSIGANAVSVVVTAEDGETTQTYTVTVTRAEPPSTDATLSSLTLSGVDFGTFDPAATEYAADAANGVTETTVTPTTNDDGRATKSSWTAWPTPTGPYPSPKATTSSPSRSPPRTATPPRPTP